MISYLIVTWLIIRTSVTVLNKSAVCDHHRAKHNCFTPAFSVTCIGDIFRSSLDILSFEMLCKRLKDRLPVKLAILPVTSGTNDKYMIITDLK